MVDATGSEVLVAEVIGLLFEPLGLDDTLSGKDSLALISAIAELQGAPEASTLPIRNALNEQLNLALARVQSREEFSAHAHARGLAPGPKYIEAAQRILEQAPDNKRIRGLAGVPKDAAELAFHDFDLAHRKLKPACARVQTAWHPVVGQIKPSALTELDLQEQADSLRDGGWLFGLFRGKSDFARDYVKPHLAEHLRDRSAEEIADVLDKVREYKEERDRLAAHVTEAHTWVAWAVNTENGLIDRRRVASMRWLLTMAEAGHFGAVERDLLTTDSWRDALSQRAAQRWARVLATHRSSPDLSSLGSVVQSALVRVFAWLAHPPHVSPAEFAKFAELLAARMSEIASALVITEEARNHRANFARVQAAVAMSQGQFGPADTNRVHFRAILEECRGQVKESRELLDSLRPQHPHLVGLVGGLREAQGLMLRDLRAQAPARGPLRVAIAGRTKAGKTTLRKVLTRDLTEDGIGRGAHRTTRTADAFAWDQVTFVDTPGVSAKDDDYDAAVAEQACRDADAVVWMFAESLHEEEAQILQALLSIKPVLVVYNAKGRVDTAARLGRFARNPQLAFTDEAGHAERSQQMASAAGVRNPPFLAVHASAARRALLAEGETHPAWTGSRIVPLESELRRVLSSQARGLRSLRLADQVRTPLLAAGGRAATIVDALGPRCKTFEHRIAREERDLHDAVRRAVDRARAQTRKSFAAVSAALPGWVEKADGRGDSVDREWSTLLAELDVDTVLSNIAESLKSDARTSGLLLDREDQLEERLQRARLGATAHRGVPLLTRAWRFLKRLASLVVRRAPRFRQEAGMGPVGWAALAMDVLATTGRAVVDDMTESRIDRRAWERNADQAARHELDRVRRRVASELDRIESALLASVTDHFAQSRTEILRVLESLTATANLEDGVALAVAEIDRLTVERLAELGGLRRGNVVSVDRVPNLHLRVTVVGDPQPISRWLNSVLDGCSSETVTVTRGPRKRRQPKELLA